MEINYISNRNDEIINKFIDDFSVNHKPIEVSFRELLPEIKNIDRYTHLIHTYPAKLLVHIPYFFLNNSVFSKEGDTVLDPFNGSGTVLLESIIAKRNAFGADANPLARLITEVKISKIDTNKIDSIILIESETNFYIKSTAALKIINHFDGLWNLFKISWILPTSFRDLFYNYIAKNRYKWFGKKESCMIPTQRIKSKFIE